MKRITTLLFALSACVNANAALITHNGYTLNTDTNIVTGGGLEWLQWDETAGLTVESVIDAGSAYYQAGWRVASGSEMVGLYNDWGFSAYTWLDNGTKYQQAHFGHAGPDYIESAKSFIDIFGSTVDTTPDAPFWAKDGYWSIAKFGTDDDGDEFYDWALVNTDRTSAEGARYSAGAELFQDYVYDASGAAGYGIAMVRSVEVPEPASITLFGLGLLGIAWRRAVRN